jgi:Ca2+-binding EF-hand superfamily protein
MVRQQAMSNLTNYRTKVKLKQAVSTFITHNLINYKESQELERVFLECDIDKDGTISKEELVQFYSTRMSDEEA